jgi:chromosome transmission fidelity protein 4
MASAEGEVLRYGPGNTDMEAMVLQIPGASIRSMAVDPKGKRVAVASE